MIAIGVVVGAILVLTPVLPLSFLVRNASSDAVQVTLAEQIEQEDLEAIIQAVSQHEWIGESFRQPELQLISVADYFLAYDGIGFLSIDPYDSCERHTVTVRVGVTCGGLCGGGELYCVKRLDKNWQADYCGTWAS